MPDEDPPSNQRHDADTLRLLMLRALRRHRQRSRCGHTASERDRFARLPGIIYSTGMSRVVLDTNVLVAALRSDQGASFQLLSLVGVTDKFQICLSVPLVLEYEDVLGRDGMVPNVSAGDVQDLIDYLCSVASPHGVFFLWRPMLRDPKDEMVLELAVSGGCEAIVTFNSRDFAGAERFGIQILSPGEFLRQIGETE